MTDSEGQEPRDRKGGRENEEWSEEQVGRDGMGETRREEFRISAACE